MSGYFATQNGHSSGCYIVRGHVHNLYRMVLCSDAVAQFQRSREFFWTAKKGQRKDVKAFLISKSKHYGDVSIPYARQLAITDISKQDLQRRSRAHGCHILESLADIAHTYQLEWSLTLLKSDILEMSKKGLKDSSQDLLEEKLLLLAAVDHRFPEMVDEYVRNLQDELKGQTISLLGEISSNLSQTTLTVVMEMMGKHFSCRPR